MPKQTFFKKKANLLYILLLIKKT